MLLGLAARYEAQSATDELPPLDLGERTRGVALAVVGAHLSGMPLHWQLTSRNARLVARTRTAPTYRLYAMTNTTPLKPALIHVGDSGGEGVAIVSRKTAPVNQSPGTILVSVEFLVICMLAFRVVSI